MFVGFLFCYFDEKCAPSDALSKALSLLGFRRGRTLTPSGIKEISFPSAKTAFIAGTVSAKDLASID